MAENQTQQRDQDVITYESFTGLRNDVTPERFTAADLAVANNIDIDKSGRIARRSGYTSVLAGAMHSLWADDLGQTCLFAQGSQLMQLAKNYTTRQIATLKGVGVPVSYAKVSERVYYMNGVDAGILENGVTRSWGLAVPPLPAPALATGNMPAGAYQFAMTYVRSDGQESGAPLAGTIDVPAGGALNFALPVPTDPGVTLKILYLSTPNSDILYVAAVVSANVLATYYGDDTSEFSTPLNQQFFGPPPLGQLIAYYRGHLFVAVGDTLYYSEGFGYELFDLRKYLSLDGRITLLAPLTDREMYDNGKNSGLFIGTDSSCGSLIGGSPEDFQYVPKVNYGAVEGSLAYVDGSLIGDGKQGARLFPYWLTSQGICCGMAELSIQNLTRTKYSFPVNGRGAALFMPGPNRFIVSNNL
jgi:hypothetical protein